MCAKTSPWYWSRSVSFAYSEEKVPQSNVGHGGKDAAAVVVQMLPVFIFNDENLAAGCAMNDGRDYSVRLVYQDWQDPRVTVCFTVRACMHSAYIAI